ncbi:MAG: tripartite tricarboxylate transporter TctB family protein [Acuticoccus sp.]
MAQAPAGPAPLSMSASQTPRADLYFSVVLTLLGGATVFEAWRMPRLENLGINPLTAPGLTPGLLGVVLTLLGALLFVRSVRAPATEGTGDSETGWGRLVLTLALCLLYAVGLVGRLPFWAATATFMAAFVVIFTFDRARPLRSTAMAAGLAIVTAAAVTTLFQDVFLVRLP